MVVPNVFVTLVSLLGLAGSPTVISVPPTVAIVVVWPQDSDAALLVAE